MIDIKTVCCGEVICSGLIVANAVHQAVRNRVSLAYANLQGEYLVGLDLKGADFRYADLRNADLHGADLRGADFTGASLFNANLQDSRVGGAKFTLGSLLRVYRGGMRGQWVVSVGGSDVSN